VVNTDCPFNQEDVRPEKMTLKCNLESNERKTDVMRSVYAADVAREIIQ
jgi:hypothetical protein